VEEMWKMVLCNNEVKITERSLTLLLDSIALKT